MSIASDLIRGHTDTIILAQLLQEDSYGYKINKRIQELTQNEYELKEATLYTAFRRLEEAGYICSTGEMKIPVPEDVIIPLHRKAATPTGSYAANGRLQRDLLTS